MRKLRPSGALYPFPPQPGGKTPGYINCTLSDCRPSMHKFVNKGRYQHHALCWDSTTGKSENLIIRQIYQLVKKWEEHKIFLDSCRSVIIFAYAQIELEAVRGTLCYCSRTDDDERSGYHHRACVSKAYAKRRSIR